MSIDDDDQIEFQKQLAAEQVAGLKARLTSELPPGMLPDGELNIVEKGSPRQKPKIIDDEGSS